MLSEFHDKSCRRADSQKSIFRTHKVHLNITLHHSTLLPTPLRLTFIATEILTLKLFAAALPYSSHKVPLMYR